MLIIKLELQIENWALHPLLMSALCSFYTYNNPHEIENIDSCDRTNLWRAWAQIARFLNKCKAWGVVHFSLVGQISISLSAWNPFLISCIVTQSGRMYRFSYSSSFFSAVIFLQFKSYFHILKRASDLWIIVCSRHAAVDLLKKKLESFGFISILYRIRASASMNYGHQRNVNVLSLFNLI